MELTVTRELHPDQLPAIHAVLDAATSHDGIAPLSEQFLRGLTNPQHHHFLLYDDTTIVGIAAYDGETAELAVTPSPPPPPRPRPPPPPLPGVVPSVTMRACASVCPKARCSTPWISHDSAAAPSPAATPVRIIASSRRHRMPPSERDACRAGNGCAEDTCAVGACAAGTCSTGLAPAGEEGAGRGEGAASGIMATAGASSRPF